jgi:DNA invertase Pin-like site-specific DNA recombinase
MQDQSDRAARGADVSATNTSDMKLAIYCRTSTHNGAGADSLDAQEEACRAWASEHGHEVVAVHRDRALSGGLGIEDRPGLAAAIVSLEESVAEGLVVHRIDRLARELHVQEVALAHAWGVGDHVAVFEAAEGGEVRRDDPGDPHRRFLRQVMGAAAELERGLIKARLHGGRRRKARTGGYIGGRPLHPKFGYVLREGVFEPVASEQATIKRILELREDGSTWAAVAATLTADETPPPSGSAWYPMTARRIAQRELRQP